MTKGEKLPFAFSFLQAEGQGPKEARVQTFLEPSRAMQSGQPGSHICFIRSQPFWFILDAIPTLLPAPLVALSAPQGVGGAGKM